MKDVVGLLFYFNQHGECSIELGHFGIIFAEDGHGFVMEFLKEREMGGGEIGVSFGGLESEFSVHNL